jgi:hypothetical protein
MTKKIALFQIPDFTTYSACQHLESHPLDRLQSLKNQRFWVLELASLDPISAITDILSNGHPEACNNQ